ncbi:MAG: twin-arginine translocation signal domain-containing protein, partial [Anaerolineae bacterium]|nr:twin-arginine translocation signal domain-containing protein [Anaerolineae bacterium]
MAKQQISRRNFLRFAGLGLAGVAMAACSPAAQPTATEAPVEPTAAEAVVEPTATLVPEATATPAPVALETVKLKYTIVGGAQNDLPAVNAAVNEYLKEIGLNVDLTIELLDWGAYGEKLGLAHSAGEEIDLEFTAPWMNNYASNVAGEVYLPLDDLLKEYAPKTWASLTPAMWNAPRIGGKIYGVINQQMFPKVWGVQVRKDLAEKYGLDVTKLTGYDDPALEEFMQKIKDGGDTKYVTDGFNFLLEMQGYDPIIYPYAGVKVDEATGKVVSYFETEAAMKAFERVKRWTEMGFLPVEPLQDVDASITAGDVALRLAQVVGIEDTTGMKAKYGYDFVAKGLITPILYTDGLVATLTAIPVTSKNPERAMMLIEAINTDEKLYNLLCYGIEGTHWNWEDQEKKLIKLVENSGYNPGLNWEFGNTFNAYYTDLSQIGSYERMKEINQTAAASP